MQKKNKGMKLINEFINIFKSLDRLAKVRLKLSYIVCLLYSMVGIYVSKMYFNQINVILLKIGDIYNDLIGIVLGTIVLSKVNYLVEKWKVIFFLDFIFSFFGLVIVLFNPNDILYYYIVMTFVYGFLSPIMTTIDNREDTALFWHKQKMYEDYRNCSRQINMLGCLSGALLCMLFQGMDILTEKNDIIIFLLFHSAIFISLYRDYYIRNKINMNCVEEENNNESKLNN